MRIEIKYESSVGGHLMDINADELYQLRNKAEFFLQQDHPAIKTLQIDGSPDELELLAMALLNVAIELRRTRK